VADEQETDDDAEGGDGVVAETVRPVAHRVHHVRK